MKNVILGFMCVFIGCSAFAGVETLPSETVAKLRDSLDFYADQLSAEQYSLGQEGYSIFFYRNEPFVQIGPNTYKAIAYFTYRDDDGMGTDRAAEVILTCRNPYRSCAVDYTEIP